MSGPEVPLGEEFAELVEHGTTTGRAHRTAAFPAPPNRADTSQNYWLLLYIVRLIAGWKPPATLAAWLRAAEAATVRVPSRTLKSPGFMGSEVGSLVYLPFHFLAWLGAYLHGPPALAAAAELWCRQLLALLEVCATAGGRCALIGQRSAKPGSDQPGWHDALLEISRGGDGDQFAPRSKRGAIVPVARRVWIWRLLWEWRFDIAALARTLPRGVAAFELLAASPYLMRCEWRWAHRPNGEFVAVWLDSRLERADIHASTPPAVARVQVGGDLVMLPRHGGGQDVDGDGRGDVRIREQGDNATCTLVGRTLHYTARYTDPSPDQVDLPPGPIVLRSSLEGFRPVDLA